jgi:cell division septation protein DedD
MKGRWIYLAGFPAVTLALCVLSYYMGLSRVPANCVKPAPTAETKVSIPDEHGEADQLTFFQKLKEPSEPESDLIPTPSTKVVKSIPSKPVSAGIEKKSGWYVQVSAFKDAGKAHELSDDLKNRGFMATVSAKKDGAQELYRVLVGPRDKKEEAQTLANDLDKVGYSQTFLSRLP